MKKFQLALMCFAALAFVACDQNKPDKPGNEGDGDEDTFVSKIDVTDNSLADWDALPAQYVFTTECAPKSSMNGLKSVKVYADEQYLNLLVEWNPEVVTDLAWPTFHVYINADNDAKTGGYGDEFADPDAEVLLESVFMTTEGSHPYNPAVFKWWGEVGESGWLWTDPSTEHGAEDFWGALVGEGQLPIGNSELVGGKCEIQLLRELIPMPFANEFTIGFDIQQNWTSCGILPNADDDELGAVVYANKMRVQIDLGE